MGILRLLLALSVYFVHTGWIGGFVVFPDKFKAVYSFFIISGFYMAFILNKKYIGNKGSYLLFITNRFLRIYPIYWTVVIATIIFSAFLLGFGKDTGDISPFLNSYSSLISKNILTLPVAVISDLIHYGTLVIHCGYFVRCSASPGLNTLALAWTLNLELLFYLIAPFLLRHKGIYRYGVIIGVFLIWYIVFHFQLLNVYTTSYSFLHAMKLFMLGYISYILYEKLPLHKLSPFILTSICILFLVFIISYAHLPIPPLRYKWLIFNDYFYYLGVTIAVPFLFSFSNLFRFDTWIAQFSYPFYISHLLTNELLEATQLIKPNTLLFIITGLILALGFSFAIILLLENPIDKYREFRLKVAK